MSNELFDIKEVYPLSVETRLPLDLKDRDERRAYNVVLLTGETKEDMAHIPKPGRMGYMNRDDLAKELASILAFRDKKEFDLWLCLIPPIGQKMLKEAVLYGYCHLDSYQDESNIPLYTKTEDSWHATKYKINSGLKIKFLSFTFGDSVPLVSIPYALRKILKPWFVQPDEADLKNCIADGDIIAAYNNSTEASSTYPLLCDILPKIRTEVNLDPFSKKQINELHTSSGFKPFPKDYECEPASVDIVGRFILSMTCYEPVRPKDGHLAIKNIVDKFFTVHSEMKNLNSCEGSMWASLEVDILTDHLKKDLWYFRDRKFPTSRKIFHSILKFIAKNDGWFSTDKLALNILLNDDNDFCLIDLKSEHSMHIKANILSIDGTRYKKNNNQFSPTGQFRFDLLIKPLLKAYCYLFAALGVLEFTQKKPEEHIVTNRDKTAPISIYDSLDAVRITALGKWCLGESDERPERIKEEYEAIADKELLLVTVHGTSLERKLYLDKIGVRLGEDRWRVSPESFIRDCENTDNIEARVEQFKTLIDDKPAPHWEMLFSRALSRADFFNNSIFKATVFYLGDNIELLNDLLEDGELASCTMRAEGRLLVVPAKSLKKFLELLSKHGIAHFVPEENHNTRR